MPNSFKALNAQHTSAAMQSWLATAGSLTARLRQHCPNLQVIVLAEGFDTPMPFEVERLQAGVDVNLGTLQNRDIPSQDRQSQNNYDQAWVRCVLLQCPAPLGSLGVRGARDSLNWVYARTVIPNLTPHNPWANLQSLGNQPLGEILFDNPQIQRTAFEFLNPPLSAWPYLSHHLGAPLNTQNAPARCSVFTQPNAPQHPLHLTEVFLPGLVNPF
jgi:chorismate--pyruvate lyase